MIRGSVDPCFPDTNVRLVLFCIFLATSIKLTYGEIQTAHGASPDIPVCMTVCRLPTTKLILPRPQTVFIVSGNKASVITTIFPGWCFDAWIGALPCISSYQNPNECCAVARSAARMWVSCLSCTRKGKYSVWYVALVLCNHVIQLYVYLINFCTTLTSNCLVALLWYQL